MLERWRFSTRDGEATVEYTGGDPDGLCIMTEGEFVNLTAVQMDQIAVTWLAMRKAEGEANRSDIPF